MESRCIFNATCSWKSKSREEKRRPGYVVKLEWRLPYTPILPILIWIWIYLFIILRRLLSINTQPNDVSDTNGHDYHDDETSFPFFLETIFRQRNESSQSDSDSSKESQEDEVPAYSSFPLNTYFRSANGQSGERGGSMYGRMSWIGRAGREIRAKMCLGQIYFGRNQCASSMKELVEGEVSKIILLNEAG